MRGYPIEAPYPIVDFINDMQIVELTGWSLEYVQGLSLANRLAIEGYMQGKSRAEEANRG